ncbi:MAG: HAD family hydrolase [Bacilli bacterium]|nr:HAD family hydrolase [Bacilli bacterium]
MDLSNIKIIFVDIDGTLVNSKSEITRRTRKSIKRITKKGIKVVLTSGRDMFHTTKRSIKAHASSIIISAGGAEIYDYKENKMIFEDYFELDKIEAIWNYCMDNKIGIFLKSNRFVYHNNYVLIKKGIRYKRINDISECKDAKVYQFLINSNKKEKIEKMKEFIGEIELNITSYSSSYFTQKKANYYGIDINHYNISKGTGITKLLEYLNIDKKDSLCIGDFYNDLEMFEECNIRVAMGNAVEEIKEKADFITKSNNEDGVAYFLDNYL